MRPLQREVITAAVAEDALHVGQSSQSLVALFHMWPQIAPFAISLTGIFFLPISQVITSFLKFVFHGATRPCTLMRFSSGKSNSCCSLYFLFNKIEPAARRVGIFVLCFWIVLMSVLELCLELARLELALGCRYQTLIIYCTISGRAG